MDAPDFNMPRTGACIIDQQKQTADLPEANLRDQFVLGGPSERADKAGALVG